MYPLTFGASVRLSTNIDVDALLDQGRPVPDDIVSALQRHMVEVVRTGGF